MLHGFIVGLFLIYSAILLWLEAQYGQAAIRHLFSDIQSSSDAFPDALFGFNTSVSVVLLWGTALLFAVAWRCARLNQDNQRATFFLLQIIFFLGLGLDDRLMLHEKIGSKLPIIEDAVLILMLGVAELAVLWWFQYLRWRNLERVHYWLYFAALFFAMMVFIDGTLPRAMPLRLSLEDLSKVWASLFLFLFAWTLLEQQLMQLATVGAAQQPSTRQTESQPKQERYFPREPLSETIAKYLILIGLIFVLLGGIIFAFLRLF